MTLAETYAHPTAFPQSGFGQWAPTAGASLFDLYAGFALQGLLSGLYREDATRNVMELTHESFKIAEAMMLQRIGMTDAMSISEVANHFRANEKVCGECHGTGVVMDADGEIQECPDLSLHEEELQ